MKKISSFQDFIIEKKKSKEDEGVKQETQFTDKEKEKIKKFVTEYEGDFENDDIYDFADKIKLNKHEVEEYIYSIARKGEKEEKAEKKEDKTEKKVKKEIKEEDDKPEDVKKGFKADIEKETLDNEDFRKVLYTGEHTQLVLMTLKEGEEIGMEVHPTIDQFFRFAQGKGKVIINDTEYNVKDGDCVIIPAKSEHNVINIGKEDFKMYTLYSPPHHKDGVEFKTKAEASKSKEEFDGETTEE